MIKKLVKWIKRLVDRLICKIIGHDFGPPECKACHSLCRGHNCPVTDDIWNCGNYIRVCKYCKKEIKMEGRDGK